MRLVSLIFLGLGISLLFIQRADAHNSMISTYFLEFSQKNEWTLTISMPLVGLHQALLQEHVEDELLPENGTYNTAAAMNYLRQFSEIKVNDNQLVALENIETQLDNHQSNFIFKLIDMPDIVNRWDFNIPAMSENAGHVNIVRIKNYGQNPKIVLSNSNDYKGQISHPL